MFCNQCGQVNSNDAKFCSNCGKKLESTNIQSPPSSQIQKETPLLRRKQFELWNPNATANWSLLFTPIFGSYLQMKNWQALGEIKEANIAKNWLIFTLVFILFINFLPYIANADPEQSSTLSRGLGFWYIIIWYFAYARKQPKYVKQKLNDNYQKKSWLIPLVSATIILFIVTFLIMLIPENTNNSYQESTTQTTQLNYFDQFDEKTTENKSNTSVDSSQQKPWEMDWSTAKSANQSQEQTGSDNGITTPYQQEVPNSNLATASTYSYTKNPSYNYHSYDDSNSDKYVYRTRPVEDTGSRISNDYYQNSDTYSSPRSHYDDYSTSSNSYSATMPQRQPSTITNCDGAGCWGSDGTRYNRGAGDTYFPSTGGSCQSVGGQMQCN